MTKITTAEARKEFSEIINRAAYGKERIVVTRRGKKLVALIPIEDLEELEELEDRIDAEQIREALKEQGKKPFKKWEDVKHKFGLK